jgi:hypothetical protein
MLRSLLLAVLLVALPSVAAAQDTRDTQDIAKCLIAENGSGSDWGAILDVLERRARRAGVTVGRMARAYCAVHRTRTPNARQLRIRALPSASSPPEMLARYNRALEAARSGGPGTCRAEHWGAAAGADWARATRLGWKPESCGRTRNAFWQLLRLGPSPRRGT